MRRREDDRGGALVVAKGQRIDVFQPAAIDQPIGVRDAGERECPDRPTFKEWMITLNPLDVANNSLDESATEAYRGNGDFRRQPVQTVSDEQAAFGGLQLGLAV